MKLLILTQLFSNYLFISSSAGAGIRFFLMQYTLTIITIIIMSTNIRTRQLIAGIKTITMVVLSLDIVE